MDYIVELLTTMMGFYTSNFANGLYILIIALGALIFVLKKYPMSSFSVFFDLVFEKAFDFFEDILGKEEKKWIVMYIVVMFFVIALTNILWVAIELIAPMFGVDEKKVLILEHFIAIPTGDKNFNIAMAIVGVLIVIKEQFAALGFKKALYEYFPILGKDYIPYTRGSMHPAIDWPLFLFVKACDIVISMFLGVLEIVGHIAKVVSLSFRLFGNIMAGWLLLGMLVAAAAGLSYNLIGFEFPVIGPIIIHLQGMLVALIQALVFPLLIAIFIKVAKVH